MSLDAPVTMANGRMLGVISVLPISDCNKVPSDLSGRWAIMAFGFAVGPAGSYE
jgi:hypothetical protein